MKSSHYPICRHQWRLHKPRRSRSHTIKISVKKSGFKIGDLYKDCSYLPLRCIHLDWMGDTIIGESLIDGAERACGFDHCSPTKITTEEADRRVAAFKKDGERGLMRLEGWAEESIDGFMRDWRPISFARQ